MEIEVAAPSPTPTRTPTLTATATPSQSPTATSTGTPTATSSDTPTPSATETPSGTPTPTTPAGDLIFADGFESGNLAAWSDSATDGDDLSVSSAAALVGANGLQAVIDDATPLYVRDDTPNSEAGYRARFSFDPNSISMASNDAHDLLVGQNSSGARAFKVYMRFSSGAYQMLINIYYDDGSGWGSSGYTLSDAPHSIEVAWHAATSAGANDGYLTLWIDGALTKTLAGVDNDTRRVDEVRLGPSAGIDAGTSGTEYFDAFESRRTTYIGPAGGSHVAGRALYAPTYEPAQPSSRSSAPKASFLTMLAGLIRGALNSVYTSISAAPKTSTLSAPPQGQTWKVYYYAGGQRIALRELTATTDKLYYLHGDHLGSTSLTTDSSGNKVGELRYRPYGETRYTWGSTPTDRRFTGQISEEANLGSLYFYNARYYSPLVGRFISADTIVPQAGNPQAFNRYAYVFSNPLRYTDPSGRFSPEQIQEYLRQTYGKNWEKYWRAWEADPYFMNALYEAEFGDTFSPILGELGIGRFTQKGNTFELRDANSGEILSLHGYQAKGPYTLKESNGNRREIKHPYNNAVVSQPIYDYLNGEPVFTGKWRQFDIHDKFEMDILAGTGIPYIFDTGYRAIMEKPLPWYVKLVGFLIASNPRIQRNVLEVQVITEPPRSEYRAGEWRPLPISNFWAKSNPNGAQYPSPP